MHSTQLPPLSRHYFSNFEHMQDSSQETVVVICTQHVGEGSLETAENQYSEPSALVRVGLGGPGGRQPHQRIIQLTSRHSEPCSLRKMLFVSLVYIHARY